MMKKLLSLALVLLMALCACACAESDPAPALVHEDLAGTWNLEYVTSNGFMVQAEAYGLLVTLDLNEDGAAGMDFSGEVLEMTWRIEDGRAYLTGYTPDGDVEVLLSEAGVLEITDEVGSMFFTRPTEETEAE